MVLLIFTYVNETWDITDKRLSAEYNDVSVMNLVILRRNYGGNAARRK